MSGQGQDCRSSAGVTTGLVDAIISISRVLARRDLTEAADALADLGADEDFAVIARVARGGEATGRTLLPFDPAHPDYCLIDEGCSLAAGHGGKCRLDAALSRGREATRDA
jgi:hypothetical protein